MVYKSLYKILIVFNYWTNMDSIGFSFLATFFLNCLTSWNEAYFIPFVTLERNRISKYLDDIPPRLRTKISFIQSIIYDINNQPLFIFFLFSLLLNSMEQIMGITMETLQATTGLEPTTKLLQQAHHKMEF